MKRVKISYYPRDLDERWYVNDLMHAVAGGFADDSGTTLKGVSKSVSKDWVSCYVHIASLAFQGSRLGEVDLTWFLPNPKDALDLAMRLSEFKPIARRLTVTVEEVAS